MRKAKQERKRRRRNTIVKIVNNAIILFYLPLSSACGSAVLFVCLRRAYAFERLYGEPYDIYALLTLGALRIILSAVQRERKAEEPPAIVYCNGEKAPNEEEPANAMKTTHIRGATDKTTEKIKQPVKASKTAHITGSTKKKGVKTL